MKLENKMNISIRNINQIWYWIYHRPGHNEMKRTILEFCGIKVTQITELAPVKESTLQQKEKWVNSVKAYGSNA